MTDREFVRQVRERAELADNRSAEQVAEALIRHLVGRLTWGEKQDLASLLPPRLRRTALRAPNTALAYAPARAFLRQLADDLQVAPSEAREMARAAASVVAELVPPDEMRDLKAQLRSLYDTIFA